ncbi:hypothetical protein [Clostridium chrysemydis]|uniref:DUF7922 domain-containing protein n=1 Tax=Clostridium chrysemydis TaxID=2665504 RepID=UPI001883CB53|nr:hypothetical protein [Clostridium chrysemydis]
MAHNKLYRNFIILQEDEKLQSPNGKVLSGYAKIEAKGDKCKVTFYAQNLKKDDEYSIVLICNKKDMKKIVDMGPIKVSDSGKGEAFKEYYVDNIAGLEFGYEKISGAGICKKGSSKAEFMLYGFMNGEKPQEGWKSSELIKCDDKNVNSKPKEYLKETKKETKKKEDGCGCKDRDNLSKEFEDYERSIEEETVDPNDFRVKGGTGDYFEGIAKGFSEVKGCFKEISYSKWYKIPVKDIEDMCNAKDADKYTVVYYPMLNYYPYIIKHGHFMMGYKCDKKGNLKYLVYAIPGKKDKFDQPYVGKSGFVTWAKCKDNEEQGYWLMFYDYKTSKVVVPSK